MGKKGHCARIDKNVYVEDDKGRILYFSTPEKAKQTAYDLLAGEEESAESLSED